MHLSLVYIDRAVELLVVSSGTSYVQQLHVASMSCRYIFISEVCLLFAATLIFSAFTDMETESSFCFSCLII